ncbi:MAG TPA: sugar transferase [Terriglobales bacterium]|nr:sugar transferase [Terriglobales bacterium]
MIAKVYYYNVLLRIGIYLFPFFAFGISSDIRFGNAWLPAVHGILPQSYLLFLLFTELAWVFAASFYKLSSVTDLYREHTGMRTTFLACFATFCLETALLVFFHQLIISRLFIVLGNVILFLLAVAARNLLRVTSASSNWSRKSEKIIVVGTDDYAIRGVELLRRIPFVDCEVQAYLQLPGQPVLVHDAPVINTAETFAIESLNFDEAVVAVPPSCYLEISPVLDYLNDLGKPVRAILDLGPRLSVRETLFQVGALQMVNLAISPVESFAYTVLKRTFDLVFATIGVVVLTPVMLTIAVLIKLFSRGPVLFLQERVGRNGKSFNLLKFRTMHCVALSVTDAHWTTRNDAGCTKIGAVLRKFSLDELPQLFNVIRGDMSLVGPRPERPHFVSKFRADLEKYNVRHCCEVGMTGWAQVNGLRGDTSISDRLRYDLYYIQNWSFGFDIRIIARTMFTILKDQNAY